MKNEQNGKIIFWQLITDLCEHHFSLLKIEQMIYLWIMKMSIPQQFRVALNHLLQLEGRGAQVRLSTAQNIDRGYLNAIIKGRKPGAEDIRVRIATHFGMTYEEMLALGRRIFEGLANEKEGGGGCRLPKGSSKREGDVVNGINNGKGNEFGARISEKICQVLEILESRTEHSIFLSTLISAYHQEIFKDSENKMFENRLEKIERRLEQVEKVFASEKEDRPRDHAK